jgi:hypothetical protein
LNPLTKHILKIVFLLALFVTVNPGLTAQQDTSPGTENEVFVMNKSPLGAVVRSAIIPGWGQFYNESYWKIPVVWGITGFFVYNWIQYNDEYQNYRTSYAATLNENLRRYRNFYRDQRDLTTIYIAIAYFLNLVDAYVDAHLFDFTVEENPYTNKPMLGFKVNF